MKSYLAEWRDLAKIISTHQRLIEARLTPDQIEAVFKNIEANSTRLRDRTMIGKTVDIAKIAGKGVKATAKGAFKAIQIPPKVMDKMGELIQRSRPIKFFDQKFDEAKEKLRAKLGADSKTVAIVDQIGNFAIKHPILQAAVIGLLTLTAAISVGPTAGMMAAMVLKAGFELMKGEKLSTAAGRTIKVGALSMLAGMTVEQIANVFATTEVDVTAIKGVDNVREWSVANYGMVQFEIKVAVPDSMMPRVQKLFELAQQAALINDTATAAKTFKFLGDFLTSENYNSMIENLLAKNDAIRDAAIESAAKAKETISQIVAGLQAATAAAVSKEPKKANESLTLQEAEGVLGRIADFGRGVASNLTNKFTVGKLTQAWRNAGSPVDQEELEDFLADLKIDRRIVQKAISDTLAAPQSTASASSGAPATQASAGSIPVASGDDAFDGALEDMIAKHGAAAVLAALTQYRQNIVGDEVDTPAELLRRAVEWDAQSGNPKMVFAQASAKANSFFGAQIGKKVPAHGINARNLGMGVKRLVMLMRSDASLGDLTGQLAPLTGTEGESAWRDGPFILVFKSGTVTPTRRDLVAVLVNPAIAWIAPELQNLPAFSRVKIYPFDRLLPVAQFAARTKSQSGLKGAAVTPDAQKFMDETFSALISQLGRQEAPNMATVADLVKQLVGYANDRGGAVKERVKQFFQYMDRNPKVKHKIPPKMVAPVMEDISNALTEAEINKMAVAFVRKTYLA